MTEKKNKKNQYHMFRPPIPEPICLHSPKTYDKLSAIGHTSVSRPSQKSGHLLGHPRNLGKVAYNPHCQSFLDMYDTCAKT